VSATSYYDFGVFLFTAADRIESRGVRSEAARDNVIFEYGLFLGAIGPDRTYGLVQDLQRKKVKLPSDLEGVSIPRFSGNTRDDLRSTLRPALLSISEKITDLGVDHYRFDLRRGWSYDFKSKEFIMTLDQLKLSKRAFLLARRKLLLAIRKRKDGVAFENDRDIAFGPRYDVPRFDLDNVILTVNSNSLREEIRIGDVVEGHLIILPEDVKDRDIFSTIGDVINIGGRLTDSVSRKASIN
jgi:hypothetical protein